MGDINEEVRDNVILFDLHRKRLPDIPSMAAPKVPRNNTPLDNETRCAAPDIAAKFPNIVARKLIDLAYTGLPNNRPTDVLYLRAACMPIGLNEALVDTTIHALRSAGALSVNIRIVPFPFTPEGLRHLYIPYIEVPVAYDVVLVEGALHMLAMPYMPASSIGALIRVLFSAHAKSVLALTVPEWLADYVKRSKWTDSISELMGDKFSTVRLYEEERVLMCV